MKHKGPPGGCPERRSSRPRRRRAKESPRLKKGDYCVAFDGPEKCVVKLVKRADVIDYYPHWWVEDIETNERWESPVSESELGSPLTEMEILAIMADLD